MTIEKIEALLKGGEGIEVEFKTSQFELNKDIFDTICAFLNRMGGHLLLGVKDNGFVEGIVESSAPVMVNNLVNMANNPNKLNPPIACRPQVIDYEGKKIIYCYVPESPEVHTTNGRMFDRTGEGDQDITRLSWRVTNVYLRKHGPHTEDRVLPYFELADCNKKMFKRVRQMANLVVEKHPWKKMTDMEIIRSAKFYGTDIDTGRSGMTVAAG
jgi:ATP-dependent DNA helicase RecG